MDGFRLGQNFCKSSIPWTVFLTDGCLKSGHELKASENVQNWVMVDALASEKCQQNKVKSDDS